MHIYTDVHDKIHGYIPFKSVYIICYAILLNHVLYVHIYMYIYIHTHVYIYTYICIVTYKSLCTCMCVHVRVYSVIYCKQLTHPSLVANYFQTTTASQNDNCNADVPVFSVMYQPSIVCMYMQSNIFPYIFDSNLIV